MTQPITAAYRWTREDKKRVAQRAKAAKMTETDYVLKAALGELRVNPGTIEERFREVERRVEALERYQDLGG